MHVAAEEGHTNIVEYLLYQGADIVSRDMSKVSITTDAEQASCLPLAMVSFCLTFYLLLYILDAIILLCSFLSLENTTAYGSVERSNGHSEMPC